MSSWDDFEDEGATAPSADIVPIGTKKDKARVKIDVDAMAKERSDEEKAKELESRSFNIRNGCLNLAISFVIENELAKVLKPSHLPGYVLKLADEFRAYICSPLREQPL